MTRTKTPAGTVRLRNINPLGTVDLPLLGREGDPIGQEGVGCLEPGEEFDCPVELAGHAPSSTTEKVLDETGAETGEVTTADPGAGLLAQVGNYELVESPTDRSDQ